VSIVSVPTHLRARSAFLLTRGVWLLVLELVITPVGWQFGFRLIPAFALVLRALGSSMIAMALLVHLPRISCTTVALFHRPRSVAAAFHCIAAWMRVRPLG
jgi:uncharacterized membrane protein